MKLVIQRVTSANVTINSNIIAKIASGLVILLGIDPTDTQDDITWLVKKAVNLRIFNDAEGVMNVSVKDAQGDVLLVSQFTLQASTKKGNRPSYINAARPDVAIPLYKQFINHLETALGKPIQTGVFGADMQVALVNDGPITIIIDSKNRI